MDGVMILQIILVIGILGVMIYLLRLYRALRLEKRIAPFSTPIVGSEEQSLFDLFTHFVWIFVRRLSKVLKKSVVLSNYGNRYNKFIRYEERNNKEGMDYVSIKFFIVFFLLVLSVFSLCFQTIHLDFMLVLVIFIVGFFLPDVFLNIEFSRKRKRIEEDLLKAIIIMNNAFSSGRNIIQATQIVVSELDGPIQDEFRKIYLDINYGLSLDVVFNRFYERVKLEDAKYITTSLSLLNKTGGDIVQIFSRLEKSIFDKKNLKNELYSLTASSRFVFKMLVGLPIIFILLIFILNPSYFAPLFTSPLGIIILIFTILLYILYIIIIRKVLEVEL